MPNYYDEFKRLDIDPKRLAIFTLKSSAKKNWYVRIRKTQGDGYYQQSLKTTNEVVAREAATKVYMDMWNTEQKGLEYTDARFSDSYRKWLESGVLSKQRHIRARGLFTRYFSPYFKNGLLADINTSSYKRFLDWRVDYWNRITPEELAEMQARGDRIYHLKKRPSETTLKSEKQIFKQFLYWCEEHEYIDHVPSLRLNLKNILGKRFNDKRQKSKALTRTQARRIEARLRKFAITDGQKDTNVLRAYGRARLYYFIYWSYHTLIRPSTELTGVKWSDVKIIDSKQEKGAKIGMINVRESKTGQPRVCVMPYGQVELITRWHEICCKNNLGKSTDYVFPKFNGERAEATQMGRLLHNKLRLWGEHLTDEGSLIITLYSVARHTSITRRIENGWHIGKVATAAGTSIKQISSFYYEAFVNQNPDKWANTFADEVVNIDDKKIRRINKAVSEYEARLGADARQARNRKVHGRHTK